MTEDDGGAQDHEGGPSRLGGSLRRGRGVVVAAVVGALVVAGAAAAATDVLSVGSVIPGGEPSGPPEHRLPVAETVVAKGSSPVAGQWRLTSHEGQGTVDNGEVVEPAGLPCIRLLLVNPPPGSPLDGSGYCGEVEGDFTVAAVPVFDERASRSELLLFGPAPEEATAVELTGDDGVKIRVDAFDGPSGYDGDAWVIAAPPGVKNAKVTWIGENDDAVGDSVDASSQFARVASVEAQLGD